MVKDLKTKYDYSDSAGNKSRKSACRKRAGKHPAALLHPV